MGKKTTDKKKQPSFVDELLKTGTTTISAQTLDELSEMVNDIPADCSYGAGCVGRNESGCYTLRLDLTK
jgi:hypothetical protein